MKYILFCFLFAFNLLLSTNCANFVSVREMQRAIDECTTYFCIDFECLTKEEIDRRSEALESSTCEKYVAISNKQNENKEDLVSLEFVVEGLKCVTKVRDYLTENFYGRMRYQCCLDIFNRAKEINEKYLQNIFSQ